MTHVAQDAAVANMKAFINRDPTVMSVQRRKYISTATGGKRWVNDGAPKDETVRRIPTRSTTEEPRVRTTADGRTVIPAWNVVALPDTSIDIGSILFESGTRYEVVFQSPVPSWRVTFEAIENG